MQRTRESLNSTIEAVRENVGAARARQEPRSNDLRPLGHEKAEAKVASSQPVSRQSAETRAGSVRFVLRQPSRIRTSLAEVAGRRRLHETERKQRSLFRAWHRARRVVLRYAPTSGAGFRRGCWRANDRGMVTASDEALMSDGSGRGGAPKTSSRPDAPSAPGSLRHGRQTVGCPSGWDLSSSQRSSSTSCNSSCSQARATENSARVGISVARVQLALVLRTAGREDWPIGTERPGRHLRD